MRRFVKMAARGVLAGAIVVMTVVPAEAQRRDDGDSWVGRTRERIQKIFKKLTIGTFGDGLSDPKPKP